jgi:hypothetical protein
VGVGVELTVADGMRLRMASLLLGPDAEDPAGGRASDVAGVVEWFGAMQAQDLGSGLWSLGARLPALTKADVESALERGEALRTWPMRGTIHLVPPHDVAWMLDLMGSRALAGAAKRREYLGLDEAVADRAVEVLGEALTAAGRLTRTECVEAMTAAGITGAGNYAYHLLWYASQRGVTCIGPNDGTEQTFVPLSTWAPDQRLLDRDEALATIAVRYFRSHGPTTRQDLAGWTGLPMADVKRAVAAAGDRLATVTVEGREMYLDPGLLDRTAEPAASGLRVLPGFDEYLLGFKDRSWMVAAEHMNAIVPGGNGVFQATVVRDGRVVATWKRSLTKTRVTVTVLPLVRLPARSRAGIEVAFDGYGRFHALPVQVRWADA